MVKLIAFLKKRADITFEQFLEHWTKVHGPLAVENLPGMKKYVQNPALRPRVGQYDGVSEVWFDTMSDLKGAFDSPQSLKIKEDEKVFLEKVDWMIVTENTVLE